MTSSDVAVLIPCFNEEATIADVVSDFRQALPEARVFVYDNASTDRTAQHARAAGAQVFRENLPGKGNVVRRMFADVEADIFVLVDGDATYPAGAAVAMIERLKQSDLDMVVAARVPQQDNAYRLGHRFGNRLLTGSVGLLFGREFDDMLSGYRIFSRRFVKSFPAMSSGFEIETELTVHALQLRLPAAEIQVPYLTRPEGSQSKLNTWADGFRIARTIVKLLYIEKPLLLFSLVTVILALTSLGLAAPIVGEYLATGLVPRFPTAVLCTGLMLMAVLSFASGLILSLVAVSRREVKRLHYVQTPRQFPS